MLHKAWNSKGEMPYCFPRSSIKFQSHTVQNITDFDPNWAFPDYRPVAAFKSLRFALLYRYSTLRKVCHVFWLLTLLQIFTTKRICVMYDNFDLYPYLQGYLLTTSQSAHDFAKNGTIYHIATVLLLKGSFPYLLQIFTTKRICVMFNNFDLDPYLQGHLLMPKNGTTITSGNHGAAGVILRMWAFRFVKLARSMRPTWGPPGSCRPQVGPMLAPWTLPSGYI